MRPAAATLLGLLLTANCVPAGTAQEHYQAALMQEKGEGDLEKAIRLYEQVIGSHEEGEEGTDSLAARAMLRIGLCQEKLGLARAGQTYEAVIEEYPEVPQARKEATHNLRSARRRQDALEERVHLTRYEKYANRPPRVPYPHQMVAEVPMEWKFRLDVGTMNPQRRRQYADPDYDDSQWTVVSIGQAWEDQGYLYDEGAWYRTRFEVDAEEGRPVHLAFGGVDRDAYAYVNGHLVGHHHVWDRPFILDISSQVVRDGENTVALYVYDGADMGGVYGLIQVLQPTGEENLDRYLANRGGEVKRSFWSRFF